MYIFSFRVNRVSDSQNAVQNLQKHRIRVVTTSVYTNQNTLNQMTTTTKVMTDWGEMAVTYRNGYYYAIKTIRGIKRQIYLGKSIPSKERLNEVADEINLPGDKWVKRHSRQVRQKQLDTANFLSETVAQLRKIEQLAKARGEDEIAKQLDSAIAQLVKQIS